MSESRSYLFQFTNGTGFQNGLRIENTPNRIQVATDIHEYMNMNASHQQHGAIRLVHSTVDLLSILETPSFEYLQVDCMDVINTTPLVFDGRDRIKFVIFRIYPEKIEVERVDDRRPLTAAEHVKISNGELKQMETVEPFGQFRIGTRAVFKIIQTYEPVTPKVRLYE
jgi:hypothetical protein